MEGTTIIEAEILDVTQKQVNRKSDGQTFTMYDIRVANGAQGATATYSTTFKENAEAAFELLNKTARLSVKIEQNGKWINRYLQQVLGEVTTTQAAPTSFGSQTFPGGGNNGVTSHTTIPQNPLSESHAVSVPVAPAPSIVEQASSFEIEREMRIFRQTACKVAAMLFVAGDSQIDFFDNVDTLVRFFDTGLKPLAISIAQDER